jgi:hypothetical protein
MYESPDTPDKKTANNTEVIMIISISVLALIVLVLAIRCCLSKSGLKNKSRAMAGMDEEETAPLNPGSSGKEAKFSNLRY